MIFCLFEGYLLFLAIFWYFDLPISQSKTLQACPSGTPVNLPAAWQSALTRQAIVIQGLVFRG
jgi:hypothetical protein